MSTILGNPIALGGGGGNELIVTAPTGSTVTATKGSITKTATEKSGTWTFKGLEAGDWEIVATKGSDTKTITVTITNESAEIHYRPNFTYTGDWEWYNEEHTIVKLKTSGIITFDSDFPADVFVVGGGASGAGSYGNYSPQISGGGGGGGYTKTQRVSFKKGIEYPATIGAGGVGVSNNTFNNRNGNAGGATSINGVSANGGNPGTGGYGSTSVPGTSYGNGGSGGSGGGSSFWGSSSYPGIGAGGSDGGSGTSNRISTGTIPGGAGQGTTTRAFGEPDGELFAGGGGGGCGDTKLFSTPNGGAGGGGNGGGTNNSREATSGQENTGGGGGGVFFYSSNVTRYSGAGGSGVILIRFA